MSGQEARSLQQNSPASTPIDFSTESERLCYQMTGIVSLFAAIQELSKDAHYHKKDIAGISRLGEQVCESICGDMNKLTAQLNKSSLGEK